MSTASLQITGKLSGILSSTIPTLPAPLQTALLNNSATLAVTITVADLATFNTLKTAIAAFRTANPSLNVTFTYSEAG